MSAIGHIEKIGNDGLLFVFDNPAALSNGIAVAMEFEITLNAVDVQSAPSVWAIEYNNEVGHGNEWFAEWWTVSDGERSFTCKSQDDAEWSRDVLEDYVSLL